MARQNGLRKKRLYDFQNHVLNGLRCVYSVKRRDNGSYTVNTKDYGTIDIYPRADKVLFRQDNKWIEDGINWVCNNL